MERLLLKGNSKDDLKLIAALATRMGLTVEFIPDEISYVSEPETLTEWGALTDEERQGIYDALEEADAGQTEDFRVVIGEFRKKYE